MPHRRSKGTGSVYKRSAGRWVAQLDLGVVNGRRKFYRRTFASQKAAQQHLKAGTTGPANPPSVAAYLADALEARAHSLRPRTVRSYQRTVDLHVAPFLGHLKLSDITPQAVDTWLRQLRLAGRGTATVRYARCVLRALLHDAEKAGWLARNPVGLSRPIRHTKREIQPLSEAQARALLVATSGHWIAPIVIVLLGLGLRLGECLGLQWADIDLQVGRLTIRRTLQRVYTQAGGCGASQLTRLYGQSLPGRAASSGQTLGRSRNTALITAAPKTSQSRRTLNLPLVVREALAAQQTEYHHIGSPWVFCTLKGTPREPRVIQAAWDRTRKAAGLPHLRLHDLRHSAASFALVLGIAPRAVADMLGHAETRTTLQTYTHVLPAVQEEMAAQIDTLLRSFTTKVQ
jgi:integrase